MANAYANVDAVGIFLSGGATNISPVACLGGVVSSKLVRGMGVQYTQPVQGLLVEDATPENGEGIGQLSIVGDTVYYTPPDGTIGAGIDIAAGERKMVGEQHKAVRVYRVAGEVFGGLCKFRLVDVMNGVLSMSNVDDADRQAGETHYRGLFLKALGDVDDVKVWIETDGQATFSVAKETPAGSAIQTIANEETAPTSVSWVDAVSEGTALDIGDLDEDDLMGVWIRRVFPSSGDGALKETVEFNLKFTAV